MTIAVIGHGRSPEGKRWGSKIDCCATVIRMWDYLPWQHPIDHGTKYDYGLFVLTPKGLGVFTEHNRGTPNRGWLAYMGKPVSGRLPDRTTLVDPASWVALGQEMGGAGLSGRLTLTRGFVAAAWAITQARGGYGLQSEAVVLVGFDNVIAGLNQSIAESFHPEYWRLFNERFEGKLDKSYPIGTAKTETHDMSVELPLLKVLADQHKVDLWLAQDRW